MDGDHPENFIAAGVFKNLLCLLRGSESSQFTPNYLNSGEAFSLENSFRAANNGYSN